MFGPLFGKAPGGPKEQRVHYRWNVECSGQDEHCQAVVEFRPEDADKLRAWPYEARFSDASGGAEYVRVDLDHPARKTHAWIEGDPFFLSPHTMARLDNPDAGWVHSQLWLEGSRLTILHQLGGLCDGRLETLLLCELASSPEVAVVSWKLEAGGYRPFRALYSGSDSESLMRFLLRKRLQPLR